MFPTHKVAIIQLYPKPLKLEENYASAASFIRKASEQSAKLAVLPEYHLTNWVPEDPNFRAACGHWQKYLERYKALAKELNICIVPGSIVELHEEEKDPENKLWNVAYFISNEGEVLGRYEKKNLWHPERPYLYSSSEKPHLTFDTPLGPVGLLLCWDLAFPEAFRELIGQGAKTIIIPTFWMLSDCSEYGRRTNPLAEKLYLDTMTTARAYENTCAVIFVNAGGPKGKTKPGTYAGLSRVAMPFIGALGDETKDSVEEGMSIVDMDMQVLDEAEDNYKVRKDMKRQDWYYMYRYNDYGKIRL